LTLHTVKWAFTTYTAQNWHPLTWLSHALDCQLFGLNPAGHHDENVLWHALDAVLLFWVLLTATGYSGRSFMVAALFALHPINVETVAWVAERKNLLSMMCFLLALGAYRWYASRPRIGRYSVVAALFAIGLMAKPQIITLPFVLLLWDYWPLERLAVRHWLFAFRQKATSETSGEERTANSENRFLWLVIEKLPLLLIAAASAVITLRAQRLARNGCARLYRAGNAVLSYGLYIKKAFWPSKLALLYPHPGTSLNWWAVAASASLLLVVTIFVIIMGRRHRYLPVGWFWFLGTLVPMLGIVQVGVQAMADRYAYVSFIGLFVMVCWGVAELTATRDLPAAFLPATSIAVLLLLAVVARQQIDYWQTDEALWAHTLKVTSRNWVAESQLASALAMSGKVQEAMPHFRNALAMNPEDSNANMGMAIYDLNNGDYRDAIVYYERALKDRNTRNSFRRRGFIGLAKAYGALGDDAKAQQYLRAAKDLGNQ
jgi:protein O-mannosyl-transferase